MMLAKLCKHSCDAWAQCLGLYKHSGHYVWAPWAKEPSPCVDTCSTPSCLTVHRSIVTTVMRYTPDILSRGFPTAITDRCPHIVCLFGSRIAIRISSARSLSEPNS